MENPNSEEIVRKTREDWDISGTVENPPNMHDQDLIPIMPWENLSDVQNKNKYACDAKRYHCAIGRLYIQSREPIPMNTREFRKHIMGEF